MKQCILLSNSNIVLMQELRNISRQNNIEIKPCRYIFEVIKYLSDSNNIILVDGENFVKSIDYLKDFQCEVFLLESGKVFSKNKKIYFDNFKLFFENDIFQKIPDKIKNCDVKFVEQKLAEVYIFTNDWKGIFIKNLIIQMNEKNCSKVTNILIKNIQINMGIKCKNIKVAISPLLKNTKLINLNERYSTFGAINSLYNYVFN